MINNNLLAKCKPDATTLLFGSEERNKRLPPHAVYTKNGRLFEESPIFCLLLKNLIRDYCNLSVKPPPGAM